MTLKNFTGRKGLGIYGLSFGLEFLSTTQTPSFVGLHALIHGQLYVGSESGGMNYLGQLNAAGPMVFSSGPVTTADLLADLTSIQLQEIETIRNGAGVTLTLNLFGTLLHEGAAEVFFGQLVYRVDNALWTGVLEQSGYGTRVIAHVPTAAP